MIRKLMMLGLLMTFLSAATCAFADEVFITPNGTKYHKETCRLIKNKGSLTKVGKEQVVEKGYGPCKKCFAEDLAGTAEPDAGKPSKEKSKKEKSG